MSRLGPTADTHREQSLGGPAAAVTALETIAATVNSNTTINMTNAISIPNLSFGADDVRGARRRAVGQRCQRLDHVGRELSDRNLPTSVRVPSEHRERRHEAGREPVDEPRERIGLPLIPLATLVTEANSGLTSSVFPPLRDTVVPMITSTLGVELGGPMSASSTSSARDRRSSVEPVVTSGG